MNRLLQTALVLILAVNTTYAQKKIATLKVKTTINCDHCRQCGSCSERISNAVFEEKGIKRVDIDEKEMTISVVYNTTKTSPEKIRKAIAASGFDADDVTASAEGYATLDACCKGK